MVYIVPHTTNDTLKEFLRMVMVQFVENLMYQTSTPIHNIFKIVIRIQVLVMNKNLLESGKISDPLQTLTTMNDCQVSSQYG